MRMELRHEYKFWVVYFITILFSVYVHEIGHCIPAWINGYWAVPTPAKEYTSMELPLNVKQYASLGGVLGSILFSLLILFLYLTRSNRFTSALLAGAIAMPGMYTLRFILIGRGHDATEFQEAQSVLGLNYSGHSLDWIFLSLFVLIVAIWIIKSKPDYKIIGRLMVGFIMTVIFVMGLQVVNNAIFDPIFQSK
jgi:hypothetical protein